MKQLSGLLVEVVTLLTLTIGCLIGYWSFSVAMTLFLLEIFVFVLIGAGYFLFSNENVQPGPILGAGMMILVICIVLTAGIAEDIGEYNHKTSNFSEHFVGFITTNLLQIWYFIPLLIFSSYKAFFQTIPKERTGFYAQLMFHRLVSILGIFAFIFMIFSFSNQPNKLILLIVIILVRFLIECWVYRFTLKGFYSSFRSPEQ